MKRSSFYFIFNLYFYKLPLNLHSRPIKRYYKVKSSDLNIFGKPLNEINQVYITHDRIRRKQN